MKKSLHFLWYYCYSTVLSGKIWLELEPEPKLWTKVEPESEPNSVVEPFQFGPAPAPASQDGGSGSS